MVNTHIKKSTLIILKIWEMQVETKIENSFKLARITKAKKVENNKH